MNPNLLFDFSVDKEKRTIRVTREFAANPELVWDAWTKPEILDHWWAPKPYQTKTKSMDFREGGFWLYAMISPENLAHWCRADYKKITHQESFTALDAFCDEDGNVTPDFPRSLWNTNFSGNEEKTTVDIFISYEQLSDLEKILEMGFKEGFTMALGNLDEWLAKK
jgi:PhnB protein